MIINISIIALCMISIKLILLFKFNSLLCNPKINSFYVLVAYKWLGKYSYLSWASFLSKTPSLRPFLIETIPWDSPHREAIIIGVGQSVISLLSLVLKLLFHCKNIYCWWFILFFRCCAFWLSFYFVLERWTFYPSAKENSDVVN